MFNHKRFEISRGAAILTACACAAASAQTLTGLGDLPGGSIYSYGRAVSNAGAVAVGESNTGVANDAFVWTATGHMQPLGWRGRARAVSADAGVIFGDVEFTSFQLEAVRWTPSSGMQRLGYVRPSHVRSFAVATNADGSVAVGSSNGGAPLQSDAFRWTESTGLVGLGFLSPSHTFATANGVSADGEIVVGMSRLSSSGQGEAFRWTSQDGMVGLGFLLGDNSSGAQAVSADGTTIIGGSFVSGGVGSEPVRWTQSGIQSLGFLPGSTSCDALSVNADGSIIVGACFFGGNTIAFLWTADAGMRRLDLALANDYGLNVAGWQFVYANSISPDGRAIAGYGLNPSGQPEAFLAMLPAPCVVDLDGDAAIGLQDLAILLAHFGQVGDVRPGDGDFDNDADVDLQDLATLLAAFGSPC